jgi:hypothetical protein
MFFRRKLNIFEYDILFYTKINTEKFTEIKIETDNDLDVDFHFENLSFKDFDIKLNNSSEDIKNEKKDEDFYKEITIETPELLDIIKKESRINFVINKKEDNLKIEIPNLKKENHFFNNIESKKIKLFDCKAKNGELKRIIVKNVIKQLKKTVEKENIVTLAKELAKDEKIPISNISILGFLREIPIGDKLKYIWKKEYFIIVYNQLPNKFSDGVVFINKTNKEKHVKFIEN